MQDSTSAAAERLLTHLDDGATFAQTMCGAAGGIWTTRPSEVSCRQCLNIMMMFDAEPLDTLVDSD